MPVKVLFYLGHPAHFHLFRHVIRGMRPEDRIVCIKSKDVLATLLKEDGIECINVDEKARAGGKAQILLNIFRRLRTLSAIIRKYRPLRLAGSTAELAILGRRFGIPSFVFFEDDLEKVKPYARITGPMADYLICPDCCSAWKWEKKKISYPSYHELAYLHPNHFTPDPSRVKHLRADGKRYFIIRFSQLSAYHDTGKAGISDELALELIRILEPHGNIFITSEKPLPAAIEKFRISIRASDMHHALAFADMFIGDSQTMTAEAAVLGTPAVRFNDFVGELGYLEDLEHRYHLTSGIRTSEPAKFIARVQELLSTGDLKEIWEDRRKKMLRDKVDFARCIEWVLNCEPDDRNAVKQISDKKNFQ